jgi:hypothetical protein
MAKKRSKKLRWKVINHLPEFVRYPLVRKLFQLDYNLSTDYVFKIAETAEEMEQAYSVLHDSYVEQGLMDSNESRLRITKYHSLPTTTLLIAKFQDEVIATITVIVDGPMGLPVDKCWDISSLRKKNLSLLEVGALAIKRTHQSKQGKILFPLCKFMLDYSVKYAKIDGLVISVNAAVRDFYKAILMFENFEGSGKRQYGFVKNDVADSVWLDIKNCQERFKHYYFGKPKEKNMYHYFWEHSFPNFIFPERKYYKTSDPVLSPKLMEHFFKNKLDVLSSMTDEEKIALKRLYFFDDFSSIIEGQDHSSGRRYARFPVHCPAIVAVAETSQIKPVIVEEVSRKGFALTSSEVDATVGATIKLKIELGPGISTQIEGKVIWSSGTGSYGLEVLKETDVWKTFIDHLEEDLMKVKKTSMAA